MALSTYSELQAAVKSWIDRNDADAKIPDFITLAEAEINSRVRIRQNVTSRTETLTAGTSAITLPLDFLEEVDPINFTDSSDPITKWSPDDIDLSLATSPRGRPEGYAILGTQIVFNRVADQTYSVNLRFYEKWDIAGDLTNWLLTNHPDAYLFGAVLEAQGWLGDIQGSAYATARREAAIERALRSDSRTRGATLKCDAALLRPAGFNITTG